MIVFLVAAGLCHRALATDPCGPGAKPAPVSHVHGGHDHPDHPCDSSHDRNCPVDHHHHHGLCPHGMPLATDGQGRVACHAFRYALTPVRLEDASLPDEPVEELDKPPLI